GEMRSSVLATLSLGALVGCGGNSGAIDDIPVKSAKVTHVDWHAVDVIGGWSWTDGVLEITDTAGQVHTADVRLSGPDRGVVLDFDIGTITHEDITLAPPSGTVKGKDLVGNYFGHKTDFHVIVGDDEHALSNTDGVKMTSGSLSGGLGVFFGLQWIDLSVK